MTARQMQPWELEALGKAGFGGGIFGAPRQFPAMPSGPIGTGAVFGGQFDSAPAQPQQKQRWMDGGKFTGRDALGLALAAIGDAFTGRPNAAGMIAGNFAQRRHAEQQQKLFEQQRAADLEDYGKKLAIKAQYEVPEAPKPGSYEWFQTATPEQIAQYTRYMDITRPVMATTWQGPQVVSRNSQGIGQPQVLGSDLPPGWTIQGQ